MNIHELIQFVVTSFYAVGHNDDGISNITSSIFYYLADNDYNLHLRNEILDTK
jgi:hypothetical protein